jgi:hypothetical protein
MIVCAHDATETDSDIVAANCRVTKMVGRAINVLHVTMGTVETDW